MTLLFGNQSESSGAKHGTPHIIGVGGHKRKPLSATPISTTLILRIVFRAATRRDSSPATSDGPIVIRLGPFTHSPGLLRVAAVPALVFLSILPSLALPPTDLA